MTVDYWNQGDVIKRGWTAEMMLRHLKTPDAVLDRKHMPEAPEEDLFFSKRVLEAERLQCVHEDMLQLDLPQYRVKRSDYARKRSRRIANSEMERKLQKRVEKAVIRIEEVRLSELRMATVAHYADKDPDEDEADGCTIDTCEGAAQRAECMYLCFERSNLAFEQARFEDEDYYRAYGFLVDKGLEAVGDSYPCLRDAAFSIRDLMGSACE